MIDGIGLAELTSYIIEKFVDCRIGIDPHSQLIFFGQETALNINVGFSESLVDGLMAIEKDLHDIENVIHGEQLLQKCEIGTVIFKGHDFLPLSYPVLVLEIANFGYVHEVVGLKLTMNKIF